MKRMADRIAHGSWCVTLSKFNHRPDGLKAYWTQKMVLTMGSTLSLPFSRRQRMSCARFWSADRNLIIDTAFDRAASGRGVDHWDKDGRSYQLRAVIMKGPVYAGAKGSLTTSLRLTNHPPALPPVHLTLLAKSRYFFEGFGGDYCWDTRSAAAKYTFDNLKVGWARSEMKLVQWDKHRDPPSDDVRGDLEMMRRFQQAHVPFVISVWWLPERFYTDARMRNLNRRTTG